MNLQGKKALCFLALPHHNKLLVPVMNKLQDAGMTVQYCTAAAEAGFELTLKEADLPYIHALDFLTTGTAIKIEQAMQQLVPRWQSRFLHSPVVRGVPLAIQDKVIVSAIENVFCFEEMLAQTKPDIIFALHELNPWGKTLGYLSHQFEVPYVTFQEGLFYTSVPFNRFHTDYSTACVVWGEATRQLLVAAGCSNDKIVGLGNMDLAKARQRATTPQAIAATRADLKIPTGNKMVAIFPSHAHYNPFDVPVWTKWLKAHPEITVVFKWHPISSAANIAEAMKPIEHLQNIRSVQEYDTYAVMGACDVCLVIGATTTGLEAVVFGKYLIESPMPGPRYMSFYDEMVADQVGGFESFGLAIENALARGIGPERQACVDTYLAKHFAFLDDKTDDRVVQLVNDMLAAREPFYVVDAPQLYRKDYGEWWLLARGGQEVKEEWVQEALRVADETGAVILGGLQLNSEGLVHHQGIAFDGNQTPISLYRMLPPDQPMFQYQRKFKAVQFPFLIAKAVLEDIGGFDSQFCGRFEDLDICLRVDQKIVYVPMVSCVTDWYSQDITKAPQFYAKWTGHLWQNDSQHLAEDGLDHDSLARLYVEQALKVASL